MRFFSCIVLALCLGLVASACGEDGASTSQGSRSANPADEGGRAETKVIVGEKAIVGDFEQEGPFAAISSTRGEDKPEVDPPDRPPPRKLLVRELKKGSGPAARRGDQVFVHYAGAVYKTGRVVYGTWPPFEASIFQLEFSDSFLRAFEEGIEGMRVGGLREVIIPRHRLEGDPTMDYVIALVALRPGSGKP